MTWVWVGTGVWFLAAVIILRWCVGARKKPLEPEMYEGETDTPTCYIHCDYNPDNLKMFYEIPDALAELVQPPNSRLSFTECLAKLVVTKELE